MNRTSTAVRAVTQASSFLKAQFRTVHKGIKKPDGTLVSAADHGAEKIVLSALKKAFPNDGILSEESREVPSKNGYRWILDPLDGTHNFLAGIPIFGTLLALEKDGEVIAASCVFPILDEIFVAEKGKGAFLNGKRIHVSRAKTLAGSVFLADGNRNLEFNTIVRDIRSFKSKGCRFRMLGEGPFGMTRVALGSVLTAVMRRVKIWDVAAPVLVVREAGGRVSDLKGGDWSLDSSALLATNGHIHKEALRLLKS